jgi:hypothetical protein
VNKQHAKKGTNTRKAIQQVEVVHNTAAAATSHKELTVTTAADIIYKMILISCYYWKSNSS